MSKRKEELIKEFKKANLLRRKKIAEREGYDSVETYLASLGKYSYKKKPKAEVNQPIDKIIVFDDTGSMSGYRKEVRKHVKELIAELFKNTPNLRVKVVVTGDYCDMTSATNFGIAYQESKLTDNQNDLVKFIDNAEQTSGGDADEFYELIIKKVVEETPWRKGSMSCLLIADADPHKIGYSYPYDGHIVRNAQVDWREEAKKSAKLGIQWDTLRITGASWYKELSDITGGVCLDFKNAEKIGQVITASTYARGTSEVTMTAFSTAYTSAIDSGDEELIGVYKRLSTLKD